MERTGNIRDQFPKVGSCHQIQICKLTLHFRGPTTLRGSPTPEKR